MSINHYEIKSCVEGYNSSCTTLYQHLGIILASFTVGNNSLANMRWYFVWIIKGRAIMYMLNAFDKYVVAIKIHKTNNKVILSFYCCSSCAWCVGTSCKMFKCNVCMYVCKFVNCYFVNTSKKYISTKKSDILLEVYLNWA